jgi:hypothetical protein
VTQLLSLTAVATSLVAAEIHFSGSHQQLSWVVEISLQQQRLPARLWYCAGYF